MLTREKNVLLLIMQKNFSSSSEWIGTIGESLRKQLVALPARKASPVLARSCDFL